jgi:hypothetical protein
MAPRYNMWGLKFDAALLFPGSAEDIASLNLDVGMKVKPVEELWTVTWI